MERIKEAVQRAREQRAAAGLGIAIGPRPLGRADEAGPQPVNEIVYTKTRTVEVPLGELKEHRIVTGFEPCLYTDAYKILSTQVLQRLRDNRWNTLAVTSPRPAEGKSLVAINLAVSLAKEFGQTALLVDADLRQPSANDYLGLPPGPGLSDYLMSDAPLESILLHPPIRGLVVLPGGTPQLDSSEMLGSRKMAQLVQELRTRYANRIVVFDLPPLLTGADVVAFAPQVEALLLVVAEGRTAQDDVTLAVDLLKGTQLIGTVLNKAVDVHPQKGRYGSAGHVVRRSH